MKRVQTHRSLKAWRDAHDLSQRDAARILGLSQAAIAHIETGRNRVRPSRAKVIAKKTGVPFEVLIGVAS